MPYGDVLLHTGDFTELGLPSEVKKFNDWLGTKNTLIRDMHCFRCDWLLSRTFSFWAGSGAWGGGDGFRNGVASQARDTLQTYNKHGPHNEAAALLRDLTNALLKCLV